MIISQWHTRTCFYMYAFFVEPVLFNLSTEMWTCVIGQGGAFTFYQIKQSLTTSYLSGRKAPFHYQIQWYDRVWSNHLLWAWTSEIAYRIATPIATDQISPSYTAESDSVWGPVAVRLTNLAKWQQTYPSHYFHTLNGFAERKENGVWRHRQTCDKFMYHLQGLLWIHYPKHAVIKEDKLTGKTAITNGKDDTASTTWGKEMVEAGLDDLPIPWKDWSN